MANNPFESLRRDAQEEQKRASQEEAKRNAWKMTFQKLHEQNNDKVTRVLSQLAEELHWPIGSKASVLWLEDRIGWSLALFNYAAGKDPFDAMYSIDVHIRLHEAPHEPATLKGFSVTLGGELLDDTPHEHNVWGTSPQGVRVIISTATETWEHFEARIFKHRQRGSYTSDTSEGGLIECLKNFVQKNHFRVFGDGIMYPTDPKTGKNLNLRL